MSVILYQLTDRKFSRLWRRGHKYTLNDLKLLARRRGCTLKLQPQNIVISKADKVVANFERLLSEEGRQIRDYGLSTVFSTQYR